MDVVGGTILILLALTGAFRALVWVREFVRRRRSKRDSSAPVVPLRENSAGATDELGEEVRRARDVATALAREYETVSEALPSDPRFEETVAELARAEAGLDPSVTLASDVNPFVSALGLSALARRADVPADWTDWAIRALRRVPPEVEPFIYQALERHAAYPVIGPALSQLDEGINWAFLVRFIQRRLEAGEAVDVDTFRKNVPLRLEGMLQSLVDRHYDDLGEAFRHAFDEWRSGTVDVEFVRQFARVWERPFDSPPALLVGRRRDVVEIVVAALSERPRRSIALIGEHGVGKTAIARAALSRLSSRTVVMEATAAQVNAGAIYIGELEGRVKEIAGKIGGQAVVWVFPQFEEALYAGQHSRSPQGLLDALLPYIESGVLTILAELTPTAYERLLAERPRVASALQAVRVRPLTEGETVDVLRHALEHSPLDVGADDRTLGESYELAQQFVPGAAAPGNALSVVEATAAEAAEKGRTEFDTTALLATLAAASGLPLRMLDPAEPLSLTDLRGFFEQRILGQPEAIDCVVERVAMIKAGLTDPTRPLGVFFFVGPTGTGKTELAKTLAEFLFGSANRLIRLDMSEYQTPDSLERLLSDTGVDGRGSILVSSVRKEPFSVVLLDEFEKAAPPIWDLFLQVFDDGRLTDQHGRVADFRRCLIILTSNLGAAVERQSLGFTQSAHEFRPEKILRALRGSLKPELLNRIDRVVTFRPFERSQMRAMLDKELAEVLDRRGLRSRPWAVELDDSAYEFIIDQGFTPELGARPLKRAVEQHLLAPIATAIVEQAVPQGDQFLLVRAPSRSGIEVAFVDPDAEPATEPEDLHEEQPLDLRGLALTPRSDRGATGFLLREAERIAQNIKSHALRERKEAALAAINAPGFWERSDRFTAIAELEYLDRLDTALATATKLGERLARRPSRSATSAQVAQLLATRLYVLDAAISGLSENAPLDVFLRVRPAPDNAGEGEEFSEELEAMYLGWATNRGMRMTRLSSIRDTPLAVSGLGCGTILSLESGLHVLELAPPDGASPRRRGRIHAMVEVVPREPGPPVDEAALLGAASRAFSETNIPARVVRRYRRDPAPLVRDSVRGYRTGKLERVLAGDFDLF